MNHPSIELVVYEVTDGAAARAARKQAMKAVERFPGFVSWQALIAHDQPNLFTDYVTWENYAAAIAAGKRVMADPEFAPFMAMITKVVAMNHFTAD